VQTETKTGEDGHMPRFAPVEELFMGRHFDQGIVVLCVRWYLSYKLSYRDSVAMGICPSSLVLVPFAQEPSQVTFC
jgi:hypothetical protein